MEAAACLENDGWPQRSHGTQFLGTQYFVVSQIGIPLEDKAFDGEAACFVTWNHTFYWSTPEFFAGRTPPLEEEVQQDAKHRTTRGDFTE